MEWPTINRQDPARVPVLTRTQSPASPFMASGSFQTRDSRSERLIDCETDSIVLLSVRIALSYSHTILHLKAHIIILDWIAIEVSKRPHHTSPAAGGPTARHVFLTTDLECRQCLHSLRTQLERCSCQTRSETRDRDLHRTYQRGRRR